MNRKVSPALKRNPKFINFQQWLWDYIDEKQGEEDYQSRSQFVEDKILEALDISEEKRQKIIKKYCQKAS